MLIDSKSKNIITKIIVAWKRDQEFPSIEFYEGRRTKHKLTEIVKQTANNYF